MNDTKLENKLEKRDIKPTAMRLLVLQFLTEQIKAVSLSDIENSLYYADRSTLFRTLKTFEKNKLIHSIEDGSGQVKYAICLEECDCSAQDLHYHFHCTKCTNTFCLTSLSVPAIDIPKGFVMQQANMVIKGVCANCNQ